MDTQLRLIDLLRDYSRLIRSHCKRATKLRIRELFFMLLMIGAVTMMAFLIPAIQRLDDQAKLMDLFGKPYTYIIIITILGICNALFLVLFGSLLVARHRQLLGIKSEVRRLLPRFERLVSYLYQLEEQGAISQELRIELDLCLIEGETALLLGKELTPYDALKLPIEGQQIDTLRRAAFTIAKAARSAVELGRRDLKALGRGEVLSYAKDSDGVLDYFVGRFRDEWSSRARIANAELNQRFPQEEELSESLLRSPKTLEDIERIAETLEMRALKLPRFESMSGGRRMVKLDMQSLESVVRNAKMPSERTRRHDTIILLERNLEEIKRGELAADPAQLQIWLKELQQIESS